MQITNTEYRIWTKSKTRAHNKKVYYCRCRENELQFMLDELRKNGYKHFRLDRVEITEGMFRKL